MRIHGADVLCRDGTSNQYAVTNTNVVKLYAMLDRARNDQSKAEAAGLFLDPLMKAIVQPLQPRPAMPRPLPVTRRTNRSPDCSGSLSICRNATGIRRRTLRRAG